MHHHLVAPRPRALAAAALAALVVSACAEPVTGPQTTGPSRNIIVQPPEKSTVCKVGPSGNYTFTASRVSDGINLDNLEGRLLVSNPFNVAAGECIDFYEGGPVGDGLWISEVALPAGTNLVKIVVQRKGGDCAVKAYYCPMEFTGTNQVFVEVFEGQGVNITFYNEGPPPPPPTGVDGCTPGFWKNSPGSWVGYSTTHDFDFVFGVDIFSPNRTLMTALGAGGGGLNALGRHATAALLNAAHDEVDFGLSTSQVIAMVQAAVAPGGDVEGTKNIFAALNERGCPLSNDNSF